MLGDEMDDFLPLLFDTDRDAPFVVPWPAPNNPGALLSFQHLAEWKVFIDGCSLHPSIPQIVGDKFRRAQRLYALSWFDYGLVKVGELVALTALELALKDRYGMFFRSQESDQSVQHEQNNKAPSLQKLLKHMVEKDGLSDELLPFGKRYGGSIAPLLHNVNYRRSKDNPQAVTPRPTLAQIRNSLAHGDPFDGLPWSGLLELVRDLIEYAYRAYLQEARTGYSDTLGA